MTSEVLSSSGNSQVIIRGNQAIQTFNYFSEYKQVKQLAQEIENSKYVHLWIDTHSYTYILKLFFVEYEQFDDSSQSITWCKVETLNSLDTKERIALVSRNLEKLVWDILRAVIGLDLYGFSHGDVSIDNIGMFNGRFVLYDYNMSRITNLSFRSRDLYNFGKSIRFHLGDHITDTDQTLIRCIQSMYPMSDYVYLIQQNHQFKTFQETIDYLDQLTIQSIHHLIQKYD